MPYDDPRAKTCLTSFETGYPSSLTWAPDSKKLYLTTEKKQLIKQLISVDIATKEVRTVFEGRWGGVRGLAFSHDGGWLAYGTSSESGASVIYLMNLLTGESTPVTSSWYNFLGGRQIPLLHLRKAAQRHLFVRGVECRIFPRKLSLRTASDQGRA